MMRAVTILGSTGSIGKSTLDVVARHPDRYRIFALSANENDELLFQQIQQFNPEYAVISSASRAGRLQRSCNSAGLATEVLYGTDALEHIAADSATDIVMAAIVGGAGLLPTLAAARAGKQVLLANKESLVMAGSVFMQAVRAGGARLLPIDSEHNALFQCLPVNSNAQYQNTGDTGVSKLVLTASGGPFLHTPAAELEQVSVEQACAHPNWSMGRKISVDSATMANKSLELIEASLLFDMNPDLIDIIVHPQSIVHSMVYYNDGSVLAQLGNPDMRTPISYGLAWPERIESGVDLLDLAAQRKLDFFPPDEARFPCLKLGRQAAATGKTAALVMNAANEVAVQSFLQEIIGFNDIPAIIEKVMNQMEFRAVHTIEEILHEDQLARQLTSQVIESKAEKFRKNRIGRC